MSTNPAPSLKALAEDKSVEGVSKSTTFRVNPDLIQFEPGFNLRADNDELELHVDRLFGAMKAGAFIPPVDVSVVNGEIVARDGHCRTRAGRRLRLEMPEFTLECRQLRGNEADAVLHMLGTGSGSKPLTPLEQGRGFLRLMNMGIKPVEIAAKLGVSRVTVDNGLTLAEAPVEVQQMVANGEVSSTTARDAIKQGSEGVAALTQAVKAERAAPTKKKNGKKGTVTSKKLRGTKAHKATNWKPKKVKAVAAPTPTTPVPGVLVFTITTEDAKATHAFLREFGGDDASLKAVADVLESALM